MSNSSEVMEKVADMLGCTDRFYRDSNIACYVGYVVGGVVYSNPCLSNSDDVEFISISVGDNGWQLNNITRQERYELVASASRPLPYKLDEGLLIKACDLYSTVYNDIKYGMNMTIAKVGDTDTYSVACMFVTDDIWDF